MMKNCLTSSVGKKQQMAISGILLTGFLMIHAVGNSTIFIGWEQFNRYAYHLHSLGVLVTLFEICLAAIFVIHIINALILAYENRRARPEKYCCHPNATSFAARSMIFTGLIILCFVAYHIVSFRQAHLISAAQMVQDNLHQPTIAVFYLFSFIALYLHITHGLWSCLQTLGINHPRYNQFIIVLKYILSFAVSAVFIAIPCLIQLG
jgi:succinate dehydrogenase / fumarate reductase cytochrome b subunit